MTTRNNTQPQPATRVAFTAHGATHAADFDHADVTLDDLIYALRGVLIGAGFNATQVCAHLQLRDATELCDVPNAPLDDSGDCIPYCEDCGRDYVQVFAPNNASLGWRSVCDCTMQHATQRNNP